LLQQRRDAAMKCIHSGRAELTECGEPTPQPDANGHSDMSAEENLERMPWCSSLVPEEYEVY
jgi:hypothetical protein